ncbi:hypothetical protein [Synechococcus sp. MIT S9507]
MANASSELWVLPPIDGLVVFDALKARLEKAMFQSEKEIKVHSDQLF